MTMAHLLLVDDDDELCAMLAEYLTAENFSVDQAHNGVTALDKALGATHYDLIILDVMLPGMNGFDVLRKLREQRQTPVLMLTARGDEVDSIIGLELGADDYLPKPCSPRVLLARIRAILRRSTAVSPSSETLAIGPLTLYVGARKAEWQGEALVLTSTEYSILEILAQQAGKVVGKNVLSEQALGRPLSRYDRSIDMHVSSLRKKLGADASNRSVIQTVRGSGYLYQLPTESKDSDV